VTDLSGLRKDVTKLKSRFAQAYSGVACANILKSIDFEDMTFASALGPISRISSNLRINRSGVKGSAADLTPKWSWQPTFAKQGKER
jgi:hypothetical protein